jgi:autophagy-related protein 101
MSSYPTISIDLIVDRSTVKEVLNGMLHTILFHRLFGTIKPKTFEVLDVTMVCTIHIRSQQRVIVTSYQQPGVSDPEIENLIWERTDAFRKALELEGPHNSGQIIITLSEKRPKKGWFPMYVGEEEVPWEQWSVFFWYSSIASLVRRIINAQLRQPKGERQAFDTALSKSLTDAVQKVLVYTSSERGRNVVPLITDASGISPFPMQVVVKVGGVEL